jgi:hypothetical protein
MTGVGRLRPSLEAAPVWGGFLVCAAPAPALISGANARWTAKEKTMPHKFQLRQLVRLNRPGFSDSRTSSSGLYEVTRLMPADETGEFSYRIKSSGAGERAVRESEITARVSDA